MAVPKRFGILRFVGNLLKVLAWIVLVLSVIAAIGAAVAGGSLGPLLTESVPGASDVIGMGGGIVAGIFVLILGLVYFLLFYAAGESLLLQLAVEENTRLTAALLLRMHQDSQAEPAAPYSGGSFATEPFEG